jgi:opacity protein-like surface antigen
VALLEQGRNKTLEKTSAVTSIAGIARSALTVCAESGATFVYGVGADFKLSHHVFVRAEYRGIVYNSPTYDLTGLEGEDGVTHRLEASPGFGKRF